MPDTIVVATPAPAVAPGVQTSEFTVTKLATILTVVATVVGVLTDFAQSISTAMPGSKWIGLLLATLGIIGTVLTALGYQVTRSQVKVAAHNAAASSAEATEAAPAALWAATFT